MPILFSKGLLIALTLLLSSFSYQNRSRYEMSVKDSTLKPAMFKFATYEFESGQDSILKAYAKHITSSGLTVLVVGYHFSEEDVYLPKRRVRRVIELLETHGVPKTQLFHHYELIKLDSTRKSPYHRKVLSDS